MLRKISIANRSAPFSHEDYVVTYVPGSEIYLEIHPLFVTINKNGCYSIHAWMKLNLTGPIEGFTVQQEIEKRRVRIFGKAKEGYFSYFIYADHIQYNVVVDRAPPSGVEIEYFDERNAYNETKCLKRGETFFGKDCLEEISPYHFPKLSLGLHRKQKFPEILKRGNVKELFPLLLAIGYQLPRVDLSKMDHGVFSLIAKEQWALIFRYCFDGMLHPVYSKVEGASYFQGFSVEETGCVRKTEFLAECAHKILGYFIQETEKGAHILPALPKECTSGRLVDVELGNLQIDLEWRKRSPRRMIVEAKESDSFHPQFPKGVKEYRLMPLAKGAKGVKKHTSETIEMEKGVRYLFDRFKR